MNIDDSSSMSCLLSAQEVEPMRRQWSHGSRCSNGTNDADLDSWNQLDQNGFDDRDVLCGRGKLSFNHRTLADVIPVRVPGLQSHLILTLLSLYFLLKS
jgi:hypothetical protein